METRSKRRQQTHDPRPQYPQIAPQSSGPTSPSSSVFQSSSSLSSISTNPNNAPNMLQTQQPGFASAPLPSPSSSQPASYFGSLGSQATTTSSSQQQQPQYSHQQQQQQYQQQQRIPQTQTTAGAYLGQRGDGGGTPETAPFLKDFNLVAEAAKRAQMACLARDLGDVGL